VDVTPRGNETRLLYAGPLDNSKVVFGVGKFHLFAEIWDEAGAFATYDIDTSFATILPTRDQYEAYDIEANIKGFSDIGDAGRISMILQAIASCRQSASWMSLVDLAGDKTREQMTIVEGETYDNLMIEQTNANTQLIDIAAEYLEFNSIEQLDQVLISFTFHQALERPSFLSALTKRHLQKSTPIHKSSVSLNQAIGPGLSIPVHK